MPTKENYGVLFLGLITSTSQGEYLHKKSASELEKNPSIPCLPRVATTTISAATSLR